MLARTARLFSWTLLLGLAGAGAGADEHPPKYLRDHWFEVLRDDTRFGFRHERVLVASDGIIQHEIRSQYHINLFSSQPQEIKITETYVSTRDLQPIAMEVVTEDLTGTTRVRGTVGDGSLNLEIKLPAAEPETRAVPLGDAPVMFLPCLADHLGRIPDDTREVPVRVIEDQGWTVVAFVAKRARAIGEGTEEWVIESEAGPGQQRFAFDAPAELVEMVSENPRSHMRRTTEDEAKQLTYLDLTGREMFTFPLDKAIPFRDRLTSLRVHLSWSGYPFESLTLEDSRQRILQHTREEDRYTATLTLDEPRTGADDATFPIDLPEMAPYLADTEFVRPTDPDIIATAREVTKGHTTAAAAARAISAWVDPAVEDLFVARTLSGPEVLECRQGKCTEHSTLFASLARAVGIPTRMVLGVRLVGESWMGHMWNEAYVGDRWMTIDSTVNEVDRSMMLLKFKHSETVDGTQGPRTNLAQTLEIVVEEIGRTESPLEATHETGVVGSTYTNVEHACRLVAPGDGWTLTDQSTAGAAAVQFAHEGNDVSIVFAAFSLPEGTPAEALIYGRKQLWNGQLDEVDITADEAHEIAGIAGRVLSLDATPKGKPDVPFKAKDYVWIHGHERLHPQHGRPRRSGSTRPSPTSRRC